MSNTWTRSMNGSPWISSKMTEATPLLRHRALIPFVLDIDEPADLQLHLYPNTDLNKLGKLERLQFLSLNNKKTFSKFMFKCSVAL